MYYELCLEWEDYHIRVNVIFILNNGARDSFLEKSRAKKKDLEKPRAKYNSNTMDREGLKPSPRNKPHSPVFYIQVELLLE
jgi:hypothetical protein